MSYPHISMSIHNQAFMVNEHFMTKALSILNSGVQEFAVGEKKTADTVTYQEAGNIAIISIDGAMFKKGFSGECGESVVSYPSILNAIDLAEANDNVETILFRVDTPGGSVAGADAVGDRIFNSKKKTITLYENMGASGGIYVFSASDELYATETTVLGSIGVIVTVSTKKDDEDYLTLVSSRAKNKTCSLDGDCLDRIQSRIEKHEEIFYSRVSRNTGMKDDEIQSVFNNGDVIFADEAKDKGFIKEVISYDSLMKQLVANPTAGYPSKIETNQGVSMELNQENFDAIQSELKVFKGANQTLQARNTNLEAQLQTALSDKKDLDESLSDKADVLAQEKITIVTARVDEAVKHGVNAEVIQEVMKAETDEEATKIILDAETEGALSQGGQKDEYSANLAEYADKHKGSIK